MLRDDFCSYPGGIIRRRDVAALDAGGLFPEMGQERRFLQKDLKTPGQSASLFARDSGGKHRVSPGAPALKERFAFAKGYSHGP
jgi:hypothetical protein